MKTRITRRILEDRLNCFANTVGYVVGYNKGNIFLDKVPCKNLYRIMLKTEGETNLFSTDSVYTPSELLQCLNFAMRAIQLDRLDGKFSGAYWASNKITVN